jgi:hypothetical protein
MQAAAWQARWVHGEQDDKVSVCLMVWVVAGLCLGGGSAVIMPQCDVAAAPATLPSLCGSLTCVLPAASAAVAAAAAAVCVSLCTAGPT